MRVNWGYPPSCGSPDGLAIVLVRSYFRLATRDHFFWPLGWLLESFWGIFGLVLGHLGLSWARFGALRVAFWNPITLCAQQLNNSSTLQPVARQQFVTRAGGLRAERLNESDLSGVLFFLCCVLY